MKLKLITFALFPLALAACQSNGVISTNYTASTPKLDQVLSAYQWETTTNPNLKPIVLNFDPSNRLSISTSCNTLGSSWKINKNTLELGSGMGTLMACNPEATQQEQFAAQLLTDKKLPFAIDMTNTNAPTLTLTSAQGTTVSFTGKMTPEAKYQTPAETIFLEISPEVKNCTGVAPQKCLLVREIKYNEKGLRTHIDKDWSLFYGSIENFKHRTDLQQIIRVKRYEIKNPAADQSKYAYIYDMTVESKDTKSTLQ